MFTDIVTGEGGKLHVEKSVGKVVIGNRECLEGEMLNETRQELERCKGTKVVVLEETNTTTSEPICVSRTTQGPKKVVCIDECETNKKCAQLCMGHGQAIDAKQHLVPSQVNLEEIFPGTLFVNDSLKKHIPGVKNVILYPDWQCEDAVDIQEDGSLRLKENRSMGQVLHYGEFCIEPLAKDMERGKYRVKTFWEKEAKDEDLVEKEYDYYSVVLCISIVCLIVTIIIYGAFPALLKLMYNKIMINFAGSLLLAFLSLVVMQTLPKEKQTPTTCIGLTLLNQFAVLSTFSLMTLMSYNIFVQLYQMRPQQGTDKYFAMRVSICYIVPGLITLVTLIVELTAPRCASVRPKIGTRYNLRLCCHTSFSNKPSYSGAVISTVEWTNFFGSTFQSLFSCSSTPACSSMLWSTFARPSKFTSPFSINYFVVLALTARAAAGSASRGTRC